MQVPLSCGGPIERPDLALPTCGDFDMLREAILGVGHEPDAVVQAPRDNRLFIKLERDFLDFDPEVPPLTISFSALIGTAGGQSRIIARYKEVTRNPRTANSGFTHDYILRRCGDRLLEFGHSMVASPEIQPPRQELLGDEALDEAQAGAKILERVTGRQLELTTGDCGVLYDRIAALAC